MSAPAGRLLTPGVAGEIARTFGDQPVYLRRIVVDYPAEPSRAPGPSRRFPGWPAPVLVLSDENQGGCSRACRPASAAPPWSTRRRWRVSSPPGGGITGA